MDSAAVHPAFPPDQGKGVLLDTRSFSKDADALMRSGNFNPQTAKEVCQKHCVELLK